MIEADAEADSSVAKFSASPQYTTSTVEGVTFTISDLNGTAVASTLATTPEPSSFKLIGFVFPLLAWAGVRRTKAQIPTLRLPSA